MNIKKYAPWSWFQDEKRQQQTVPVSSGQGQLFPGHPVSRLHRELDRLFDDAFRDFPGLPRANWEWPDLTSLSLRPSLDIKDTDDSYIVSVEVPGVAREDVDIRLEGNTLMIRGEKKQEKKSDKENYHCVERHYGSFERMLTLPQDVDAEHIDARFKDGVLTINIKRKAVSSPKQGKKIDIKAAV